MTFMDSTKYQKQNHQHAPLNPDLSTELQQIPAEWNNAQTDFSQNSTIHQLFEAQAEKTPTTIALISQDQSLSYRELNHKANQLARFLQRYGVGPEVPVGICLDRSAEMVISLLGILKAGGAYIPLDPNYPPDRLILMMADAASPLLLTQAHLLEKLPPLDVPIIALDAEWESIAAESTTTPHSAVTAHNLAYIIYTSGSTGTPKGVMIEHRALVNFTEAASAEYAITAADRVLQFASISFDASAEEIYPCLTRGGTLVLRPDDMAAAAEPFLQYCRDLALTVLDLPTSYWHQLVGDLAKTDLQFPPSLRLVIIGGEKAQSGPASEWFRQVPPSIRLVNTYGPTEATVVATTYNLSAETISPNVPIGQPLGNTRVYILDKHLQPVSGGEPGELHLGGKGLARGYLNQPKLTGEKFIRNPFSHNPEAQLYKTGDLARYRPDGNIEFLGRIDNQVKIRGFRIEPGEIETALSRHPAVREVVVLARSDSPGDKRLAAYLTLKSPTSPTISEWRQFLSQTLPHYMIPSAFVVLDKFPINTSGKVDQKALPRPELNRSILDGDFAAPDTDAEKTLANIWAKILKIEGPGIHDNFFDLGGDSILSIQITSEANRAGLLLTPDQLFAYPTIAQLAAVAQQTKPTVTAQQSAVTGPLPLTPMQRQFLAQNLQNPHHKSQGRLLEVHEPLDTSYLVTAIEQLLIHHDALRLRLTWKNSTWHQTMLAPNGDVPFSQIDISTLSDAAQRSVIQSKVSELQASLNLSTGPLMSMAHFKTAPQKPDYLLVIIHHLSVDDISWQILLEDFERLVQQLSRGETPQLPAKTTSYKQWALRLTDYTKTNGLKQELSFWLTAPEQHPPAFPVDFPLGPNDGTATSTRTITVSLTVESTRTLLDDVPKAYQTHPTEVLLTALAHTFNQWAGTSTMLINLEGDGRKTMLKNIDLSRTVGCFTTNYPVFLSLGGLSNPDERLKSVKEQLRRVPHNGIGYGLLRYLSQSPDTVNKLQTRPPAQLSFKYRGQFDQVLPSASLFKRSDKIYWPDHRKHLLEIEASLINGQLQLHWLYNPNVHRRATIERLAHDFMAVLETLMAYCLSPEAGGYTPSDFPEADLNQQELDDLLSEIGSI